MDILEFTGEYRWLSNFWPAKVVFGGMSFPSIENAYQASKADVSQRDQFCHCTASEAKRSGRLVEMRQDWESEKIAIMRSLITQKFSLGSDLAKKLTSTGNARIVEGNWWGDTFWGTCRGKGQNMLGKLLMERREYLLKEETAPWANW